MLLWQCLQSINSFIAMNIKLPYKYRRFATEPPQDIGTHTQGQHPNNTLKELKMQVGNMNYSIDNVGLQTVDKNGRNKPRNQEITPLHHKIQNKRHALKRLPQINNTVHQINCNDEQTKPTAVNANKFQDPLFIVNSLFQIMKQDIALSNNKQGKDKKAAHDFNVDIGAIRSKGIVKNQFDSIASKSVKFNRPPRLINNELNRLNNYTKLVNRKIYSEQKRRPRMQTSEIELLTFYKPKNDAQNSQGDKMRANLWQNTLQSNTKQDLQYRKAVTLHSEQQYNQFL